MAKRALADISKWPVIWRVVAPGCGSYNHDMVFIETDNEQEARKRYRGLRLGEWPVRLERVHCGPLPHDTDAARQLLMSANAQNPGDVLREIPGRWSVAN